MLEKLVTEQPNPASANIDRLSTVDVLRIINAEDAKIAEAVEREIPQIARTVDSVAAAIENGGRLFYIGAGTSGRLGVLDASECPPTFNVPYEMVQGIIAGGEVALSKATEASEDDPASGARDLAARGFSPKDILIGIAASGRTPYVLGAIRAARSMGAVTAGISCVPRSQLSGEVDIPIAPVVGPEVVTGSTRMKAGTATKLVLNMISTAVMIRLGYVYGNLMVNVQPKNEKLVARAIRIIGQAVPADETQAAILFERSGNRVPVAIVMGRLGLAREQAESRLQAARGVIARALEG